MIRVAVVDDEPLARRRILRMLRGVPGVQVVAECRNGEAAVAAIRALRPEVVFLDVQMPGMDGFQVLESLGAARAPAVVFTTAYDEYALRAFEVQALDYLLKPFTRARFCAVLERVRSELERRGGTADPRLQALLEAHRREPGAGRLLVKKPGRVLLLDTNDIDWIQAEGNYARLWSGKASHLLRRTLASLESSLDPARFVRVHRSAIVNIERVKEMHPWFRGDCVLVLKDGTRVTLSRTFRQRVRTLLGQDF